MSYLALCAAPFDNNDIPPPINSEKKRNGKNKTIKKAIKEPMENKAKKVTSAMISNLHEQPENTDNSTNNYTPPPPAKQSNIVGEENEEGEKRDWFSSNFIILTFGTFLLSFLLLLSSKLHLVFVFLKN